MMQNNYKNKSAKRFFMFPLLFIVMALILGAVVMWLWNAILPALLNINTINYWQATGLLVLCRILFGSFRRGSGYGKPSYGHPHWKDKWTNMNDEEKEKFKEEWKRRCDKRRE